MTWKRRHLVDIAEFTEDEMRYLMEKAFQVEQALKRKDRKGYRFITDDDVVVAKAFFEDSTRTRISFESAIRKCGGVVEGFDSAKGTSYATKGESTNHTIQMINRYGADAVAMRHHLDGAARFVAMQMDKTFARGGRLTVVINAGDGKHQHPTQTILDRYTILKATGRLDPSHPQAYSLRGLTLVMANDLKYGRVPHSNVMNFAKDGVHFIFVAPNQMQMPETYLRYIEACGSTYEIRYILDKDVCREADVLLMYRSQLERMPQEVQAELRSLKSDFTLNVAKAKSMKPGAIIMHPLPLPRWEPEIAPEVDDLPNAYYFDEAEHGLYVRIPIVALSTGYLGEDFEGEAYEPKEETDTFWTKRQHVAKEESDGKHTLRPISNGIVIDHLPPGLEVELYLHLRREIGESYRAATVPKKNMPDCMKGMLMLPGREPDDKLLRTVAAFVGGVVTHGELTTVNHIVDQQVVDKFDLGQPRVIEGLGNCSNIIRDVQGNVVGGCISHPHFCEHVTSRFVRAHEGFVRCYFCDHLMRSKEIFG
ncbi:TPA: aspartate carbamoyltransferase [Candidatus Falkowbacteria bacterium]|nr:aspartate carbamoyltransferase [Candidatus Falkowbacteria bacterium]